MKFLIISDMFSLESWLIEGESPEIMPAVYEFYNYLGNHEKHTFEALIIHPKIDKVISFPNGSKIHIHKLNVPFHYVRKFTSVRFLRRKAQLMLNDVNEFTHVYGMTIYANVAKQIGQEYNLPSVGRLFGSLIWDVIKNNKWLKARTRFHYQLREINNPCDITICTEDGTQFDLALQKYSPNAKVYMMYNGVNASIRKKLLSLSSTNKIDSNKIIKFCYIARLTYWKRQDLALQFISQLKQKGFKVQLDIYGKGEQENNICKQINKLDISNEVKIKGSIAHNIIAELLRQYHVSMFLYDASNLGNAMWESALAGRLILTRDTGKTPEIFSSANSLMMEGTDVDNVVKKFINLLDKNFDLAIKSRLTVNNLLPNWKDRFDDEMNIIYNSTRS